MWEPSARKIYYVETIDGEEQLYNIAINFKRCIYLVYDYLNFLDKTIAEMNEAFKDNEKYYIYKHDKYRVNTWNVYLTISIKRKGWSRNRIQHFRKWKKIKDESELLEILTSTL
jgi:hypothetical protein